MKISRLDGPQLDFWVAKSSGLALMKDAPAEGSPHDPRSGQWHPANYRPSVNWAQGGPIVSNEWFQLEDVLSEWFGPSWSFVETVRRDPLKWFMRAYVASVFGDEVEEAEGWVDQDSAG